jgi:hypothetical protein
MLKTALNESNADVIVTADSDLVFHPQWFDRLLRALPRTDGLLHARHVCYDAHLTTLIPWAAPGCCRDCVAVQQLQP